MADISGADRPIDPADRGALEVRDRAVQNIVVAAALIPSGVLRHGGGLGRLAGRDLPRATVDVAGDRVRAAVDVAVQWGRPLQDVAGAVRREIRDALATQSGLTVDGVTVHVAAVAAPGQPGTSGRTPTGRTPTGRTLK